MPWLDQEQHRKKWSRKILWHNCGTEKVLQSSDCFERLVSNDNLVSARIPKHRVTVRKLRNFESFKRVLINLNC